MKFLAMVIDLPRSSYTIQTVKRETWGERLGKLIKGVGRTIARSVQLPHPQFSSFSTKAAVLGIVLGVIVSELTPGLFPIPA